jgi:lipoprotein-anchoring transpeptidase ErfK/SrfK
MTHAIRIIPAVLLALSIGVPVTQGVQQGPPQIPSTSGAQSPAIPLPPPMARALAAQVALDNAHFSPGEIDGKDGAYTRRALEAFASVRGLGGASLEDPRMSEALGSSFANPVKPYTITEQDAAGPFLGPIPSDMMEQAKLPSLGYSTIEELLSERFHMSPALLKQLNAGRPLTPGTNILVAAVEPFSVSTHQGERPKLDPTVQPRAASVELTNETRAVIVRDGQGAVLLYAPVTVGSEQDPLPIGDWTITGVFDLPVFNYNPDLFWDADEMHAKARIQAGPNNPVGVVWIGLNRPHFGFHGTPEPSRIGRTESHGCVRLTNWDAMRLAALVDQGTPVRLR